MSQEKVHAGSNMPEEVITAKAADELKKESGTPGIGAGSWTTWALFRTNGVQRLNITNPNIRSGSRIFASISEYNTDPSQNRFIGNASLLIYSVSPYNGGVIVLANIAWSGPINICVSLLIDP